MNYNDELKKLSTKIYGSRDKNEPVELIKEFCEESSLYGVTVLDAYNVFKKFLKQKGVTTEIPIRVFGHYVRIAFPSITSRCVRIGERVMKIFINKNEYTPEELKHIEELRNQ